MKKNTLSLFFGAKYTTHHGGSNASKAASRAAKRAVASSRASGEHNAGVTSNVSPAPTAPTKSAINQ